MRAFCILTELCVLGSPGLDRLWLYHGALVELHWALGEGGHKVVCHMSAIMTQRALQKEC